VTGGMEDGAPDPELPLVVIRRRTWRRMCGELRRRGEERRESGAFLLAPADETSGRGTRGTVTAVVYYDDLDAHCLTGGNIFVLSPTSIPIPAAGSTRAISTRPIP
jgi:hypothetical protein